MTSFEQSDMSDEASLLDENLPEPALRRVSSASSSDSAQDSIDEAGFTRPHTINYTTAVAAADSSGDVSQHENASTIVRELENTQDEVDDSYESSSLPSASKARYQPQRKRKTSADSDKTEAAVPLRLQPSRATNGVSTSHSAMSLSGRDKPSRQNLTLREQEKLIDQVKKENFSLKLKIFFLEERLAKLAPEHIDAALRENIELKVNFQTCQQELKRHRRMCLDLNKVVESLQSDLETVQPVSELEKEVAELRARNAVLESRASTSTGKTSSLGWQDSEDYRAEIQRLRDELDAERDDKERILARHRLGSDLQSTRPTSRTSMYSDFQSDYHDPKRLEKKVASLEAANSSLEAQLKAQITLLSSRNEEKERLYAELEAIKQANQDLETELSLKSSSLDGRTTPMPRQVEERIQDLEDELTAYRDKFSAISLEMERKEAELQELVEDGDARDAEFEAQMQKLQDDWVASTEELRNEHDALDQALAEKEHHVEELNKKIEEFVASVQERDTEIDNLNDELDALTGDLKKLGSRVYELEEELAAKDQQIQEMDMELQKMDHDTSLHTQVVSTLKDKLTSTKHQVSELSVVHETTANERDYLREQVEYLALQTASTEERVRAESNAKRELEEQVEDLTRRYRELEHRYALDLEARERDLRHAQNEVSLLKDRVQQKEADLGKLQDAVRSAETSTLAKHSSDRLSLELEIDRLKRDLTRTEKELERATRDYNAAEARADKASMKLADANSELKEVQEKLDAQTRLRLGMSDKLDATTRSLAEMRKDLASAREQLAAMDRQSNKENRASSRTDGLIRDQLAERNDLLQSIYQSVEQVIGGSPRKADAVKPSANFGVFSDLLQSRMRRLVTTRSEFERQIASMSQKFDQKYGNLKATYESRMRQLDHFEAGLKAAAETQKAWRGRVQLKNAEIENLKNETQALQTQISTLKGRMPVGLTDDPVGLASKLVAAQAKAAASERKALKAEAAYKEALEKLNEARDKVAMSTDKWEARVRELEKRNHEERERTKRERQGGKERVAELSNQIHFLEKQLDGAEQRGKQMDHLVQRS